MNKQITERIFETSNIPAELLTEKPEFPKKVKIEVTSRCDLNCFFCSRTYKNIKKGDIDKKLLFRIICEMKDLDDKEIGLFWLGEPLLVKELPAYIEFTKKTGIDYVFITTNGRLANPQKIKELFNSGLDSIKFSINSGDRKQYYKVCGVDAFDKVISNVRFAYQCRGDNKRPAIYASTIFDLDNRNDFDKVHGLIGSYVDQHYPLRLYGQYTFTEEEEERFKLANDKVVQRRTLESMLPCWSLFTEPHISFDGYMSACYCDHDEKFYMGNLNEMSLIEAWQSKKFMSLRKSHLSKDVKGQVCENCIAYKH